MANPLHILAIDIYSYFINSKNSNSNDLPIQNSSNSTKGPNTFNFNNSSLIRFNTEKLKESGDITIPNLDIWQNHFINKPNSAHIAAFDIFGGNETDSDAKNTFIQLTSKWTFPLTRIQIVNERCLMFIRRRIMIEWVMRQVLDNNNNYGKYCKIPNQRICVKSTDFDNNDDVNELSIYRKELIAATLKRILQYSSWKLVECQDGFVSFNKHAEANKDVDNERPALQIYLQSVAAKGSNNVPFGHSLMRVGIVTDPCIGGKLAKISTQEYLSLRSKDMQLMAMHKYGIRANKDSRFCELIKHLGTAAVTVDLLEVKHSSPVQIIRNGQGSTKGAAFILYNSARLESLLRAFDERVFTSEYGELPPLGEIDFNLLNEEEEWQLIFSYISAFPNLIERSIDQLEMGNCALHLIVRFLSGLVATFSVYYRRIRILTETRSHLMPFVYARIYFIKVIREVLNKTLALLDIQPVQFM